METRMIEKLKNAGVAADVILDLILDDLAETNATPEEVPTGPTPEREQEAAAPAAQTQAPDPAPAADPVMERLDKLIGIVQRGNILRDGRGEVQTESVDDILAAMITPAAKGGK